MATDVKPTHNHSIVPSTTDSQERTHHDRPTPTMSPEDVERLEAKRIDDWIVQSLHDPDAVRANCGVSCAKLTRLGFRLEKIVHQTLDRVGDSAEGYEMAAPALRNYITVAALANRVAAELR